ncbi:acyl-CoA carboxylase epsilon subunit [Streptomyces sp. NPDC096132]|uniref:acyl-CoA carboxylase epsilon subunit n=1 Tax=Streptomyces sp. NPDC096132 TaxID=3366075 RepID=UPI003800CFAA
MTAARDLRGLVRVVRGTPRPDELAAVLVVLTVLTASGRGLAATPPGPLRAGWPDAARPSAARTTAAPAWAAAPGPQWRESFTG